MRDAADLGRAVRLDRDVDGPPPLGIGAGVGEGVEHASCGASTSHSSMNTYSSANSPPLRPDHRRRITGPRERYRQPEPLGSGLTGRPWPLEPVIPVRIRAPPPRSAAPVWTGEPADRRGERAIDRNRPTVIAGYRSRTPARAGRVRALAAVPGAMPPPLYDSEGERAHGVDHGRRRGHPDALVGAEGAAPDLRSADDRLAGARRARGRRRARLRDRLARPRPLAPPSRRAPRPSSSRSPTEPAARCGRRSTSSATRRPWWS